MFRHQGLFRIKGIQDTEQRRKTKKKIQRLTRHGEWLVKEGESEASLGREHQRSHASNSQRRTEGELRSQVLAMASNCTREARYGGLTSQSWRGTNPLVKKHQLAMANGVTREAS